MRNRQPLPRIWMLTDPRMGESLFAAIRRLPRGSGIVVRHDFLPLEARRALFARVERLARRHGHVVLRAGDLRLGRRESGIYRGRRPRHGLWLLPAHDLQEVARANRLGADAILLSPVFPTRSHPGASALGPMRFATLARRSQCPVIALGGMTSARWQRLKPLGAYGWAAIDAWIE